MLDPDDLAGQDVAATQLATQRYHGVPRLDAAGRDLGQERLVRHVRMRVDDRDLRLALAELAGQAQGHVEPDMAGADDEDPMGTHVPHHGGSYRRRTNLAR